MSLSLAALQADHQRQLGPAAARFETADLTAHLTEGALLLDSKRPRVVADTLALVVNTSRYPAPADCWAVLSLDWGEERRGLMPWDAGYIGPIPGMHLAGRELVLWRPPSTVQISLLGAEADFRYFAHHAIGVDAEDTTIALPDRPLLLLAALIVAMRQLSTINVADPITLHRGIGALPANSTPAAHYEALLRQWERVR